VVYKSTTQYLHSVSEWTCMHPAARSYYGHRTPTQIVFVDVRLLSVGGSQQIVAERSQSDRYTIYRTKCIIPYTVSESTHGGTGREAHSAGIASN
jgi:hypothetical protein